ncbi:hypothetical protein [Emticicia sp. 17c]|uniref:hypothetical protein n=1 Tax=Emticicia sp. 17c TaxID=3127704 RepID=UPI00301D66CF
MQTNKTYLALLEVDQAGQIQAILAQEEKSPEELSDFFAYHQALESEYQTCQQQYQALKQYHETATHRNEMALNALIHLLSTQGIYDPQSHRMDLSPLVEPYFEKFMAEREAREQRLNFIAEWWEQFKLKRGLKLGSILMAGFSRATKILINIFQHKK